MEPRHHKKGHILHFVGGILGSDLFEQIRRHVINGFRQDARQCMIGMLRHDHPAGERRLFHQRIIEKSGLVAIDVFLCHVVKDIGSICLPICHSLQCAFSRRIADLPDVLAVIIFDRIGNPLIHGSDSLDIAVKVSTDDLSHTQCHVRLRRDPVFFFERILGIKASIKDDIAVPPISISEPFLSGPADHKLIRQSDRSCHSPEIVRNNPFHLAVLHIRVRVACRITKNLKEYAVCCIGLEKHLLLIGEL